MGWESARDQVCAVTFNVPVGGKFIHQFTNTYSAFYYDIPLFLLVRQSFESPLPYAIFLKEYFKYQRANKKNPTVLCFKSYQTVSIGCRIYETALNKTRGKIKQTAVL